MTDFRYRVTDKGDSPRWRPFMAKKEVVRGKVRYVDRNGEYVKAGAKIEVKRVA